MVYDKMIIIITGASKGIGFEIARQLVAKGHTVYSLSRSAPPDTAIRHIKCDIACEQSVKQAFAEFSEKENRLDILINNAGIGISGPVEHTTAQDIHDIYGVNFFGAVWCTQSAISIMRAQENQTRPKILFISSLASVFAIPFQSFYSTTKSGLTILGQALRLEVKPLGIDISTLLLGDINTGFTASQNKSKTQDAAYAGRVERCLETMARDESNGTSPDKCARVIIKILGAKRLKASYVVGKVQYKMFYFLNKILPQRFILALVNMIYGK